MCDRSELYLMLTHHEVLNIKESFSQSPKQNWNFSKKCATYSMPVLYNIVCYTTVLLNARFWLVRSSSGCQVYFVVIFSVVTTSRLMLMNKNA